MANFEIKPRSVASQTGSFISDPGITYNQSGYIYNDTRATYGGVFGKQDMFFSRTLAKDYKPVNV